MKILAIETSCDETAIALLECKGDESSATFKILGNSLISQINIHQEFGGVFPAVAKREHAKNLVPLLLSCLEEAGMLREDLQAISAELHERITQTLAREFELSAHFFEALSEVEVPNIDAIAVTYGPGLEPALWVGVSFAKALALLWDKPLIAVNHMEGHLLSALANEQIADNTFKIADIQLPLLGLLVSGGHTEIQEMNPFGTYALIGQTRDDAVGEAYDKVARMLGLPYPGGPEISKLADSARERAGENPYTFPRPMLHDPHCDFSFSGLKTSVLYTIKGKELTQTDRENISLAFEDAVSEVLYVKTKRAIEQTDAHTLAIGGGVSANKNIKRYFQNRLSAEYPHIVMKIPVPLLTGDNAVMIAIASYYHARLGQFADVETLSANGNLSLAQ